MVLEGIINLSKHVLELRKLPVSPTQYTYALTLNNTGKVRNVRELRLCVVS